MYKPHFCEDSEGSGPDCDCDDAITRRRRSDAQGDSNHLQRRKELMRVAREEKCRRAEPRLSREKKTRNR